MIFSSYDHKIAICLLFITSLYSQSLNFVQEEIEVTIGEAYCTVKGRYYFNNKSSTEVNHLLYYPFALNDNLLYPDSITVIDVITNEKINFSRLSKGLTFPVHLEPKSIAIIEVIYFQKTLVKKMEYILTTTKEWGKPLEKAEFTVKIPAPYQLKYLSMDYDQKIDNNQFLIYKISKYHFYPDQNLIISWEE